MNSHDTLTLQSSVFGISISSEVELKTLYAVLRICSLVHKIILGIMDFRPTLFQQLAQSIDSVRNL
jgi:hypothetical protein